MTPRPDRRPIYLPPAPPGPSAWRWVALVLVGLVVVVLGLVLAQIVAATLEPGGLAGARWP